MTRPKISAMMCGGPVALDAQYARAMMEQEMPDASADDLAMVIERGERYAISRNVAVLPLSGLLTPNKFGMERAFGWSTYQGVEQSLAELVANDDVVAIVMPVNSPGGLVIGCEGARRALAAAVQVKPVHALVHPLAASAAYWIASQASDITMTPGSVAGCIGTAVVASSEVEPFMGEQFYRISSRYARAKKPDPATPEGMAELQRDLDHSEAEFHAAVAAGRGIDPAVLAQQLSVTDDPADGGAVFAPADAMARGLADAEQTEAAFYAAIMEKYAPAAPRRMRASFAARARMAALTA